MVQYLCHFLRRRRKNFVKLCHQSLDIRSDKKLHTHAWAYECHQQQYDFLNCKKWHKQWYMHFFSTVQTVTWCSGSVSWTQETHLCFSFGWVTVISIYFWVKKFTLKLSLSSLDFTDPVTWKNCLKGWVEKVGWPPSCWLHAPRLTSHTAFTSKCSRI